MKKKIFTATFLISFLSLLSGVILVTAILYRHFSNLIVNELSDEAHYIAAGLELDGLNYLKTLPVIYTQEAKRITLIASDGTVIFDSKANISDMDNHSDRKEFIGALKEDESSSIRYSGTLSTKTIYYALRLSDSSVLRTAYTQASIWSLIAGILPQMTVILGAVILISAAIAWMLSRHIAKPIVDIDLEHPDIKDGYDELIPLIRKINNQNDKINSQIAEIKHSQQEFKAITENMGEGLLIIERLGHLLSYNSAAIKLLDAMVPSENSNIFLLNRSEALRMCVEKALTEGCQTCHPCKRYNKAFAAR